MRQNPCRNCELSVIFKGRHTWNWFSEECDNCEKKKLHKEYLATKRKYKAGRPIRTLEDLLGTEFVIWGDKPLHIEFIKSLQLRLVLQLLKRGCLYYAIKKEESEVQNNE